MRLTGGLLVRLSRSGCCSSKCEVACEGGCLRETASGGLK